MSAKNNLKKRVEKAVTKFADEYMQVSPRSVVVDIHTDCFLATLQDIIPPAEKNCAYGAHSRELVEKCYSNVFDNTKKALQKELEYILGQLIGNSIMTVDLQSGNGVMIFNFAGRASAQGR